MWQQGRFKRFLDLIANRDKAGYATYFEAAMGMPIEQILPLWQQYLDDVVAHRKQILLLPASSVLDDQTGFEKFVRAKGIPLEQPTKK